MISSVYIGIASVLICASLLVALSIRKITNGRSNFFFFILICILLSTSAFDAFNVSFGPIIKPSKYNAVYLEISDYLYFSIHNFVTPFFILYVSTLFGFWYLFKKSLIRTFFFFIPYMIDLIFLVINLWKPIVFYVDDNGIYHRGGAIYVLYAVAAIYVILAYFLILKYRKTFPEKTVRIILLFLDFAVISVALQMLWPSIHIETMALTIVVLVIALTVHRPEENLDQLVNAQSYNAFMDTIAVAYKSERPLSVVLIKIQNHTKIRSSMGIEKYTYIMRGVSDRLAKISKIMDVLPDIYYLDRASFALVTDEYKSDLLIDMGRLFSAYMQEPAKIKSVEVKLETCIVYADLPSDFSEKDSFMNFVQNYSQLMPAENKLMRFASYANNKQFNVRVNLDSIIERGLSCNNYKMYYQPIYSVKEKKFVSAEALIRLFDKEVGYVSPGLFIPAAEKTGAIHEIGNFVIEDVCRFIHESEFKKVGLEYIEINLSVAQCIESNLVDKFMKYLGKYRVEANQLNIEITETAVDYDPVITEKNISALCKKGFSFSLDDFGTGFSNVARAASMPVDIIKFDKSLVDESDNPQMWIVIERMTAMLKKLNKKILVEGIEDERNFNKFVGIGCDYIQGFYFSKPLPENEFIDFVRKANK